MTNKRGPVPAFFDQEDSDRPSTRRSFEPTDEQAPDAPVAVYYEPQPLVPISNHKTIEVETVKLSEDIDPRKLRTELCLPRPASVAPDSVGPQSNSAVVSTQRPLAPRRPRRAPLTVVAALLALLFVGVALRRFQGALGTLPVAGARLAAPISSVLVAPPSTEPARPVSVVPEPIVFDEALPASAGLPPPHGSAWWVPPPGGPASAAPPSASAPVTPHSTLTPTTLTPTTTEPRANAGSASSKPSGTSKTASPPLSDRPGAVAHDSKSKRAIY